VDGKKIIEVLKSGGGPYCNFCGMNEELAGYLVAGPNDVHICWQCADSALEAVKVHNAR